MYTVFVHSSTKPRRRPTIGVFDSGFGGLTVLKALLKLVPNADYAYFGDTARLPYGSKSVETVARYAVEASHFLESQGAQLLVIACNTATALALDRICAAAHVPVVGVVEPGADAAAAVSKNRKIVVIGTNATVSSHAYQKALQKHGLEAREKACPLLVPLVEEGWVEHPVTEQVARIYLAEAFADGFHDADTMVLGCTHYPLLKPLLRRAAPDHVSIVDSAESTARAVSLHFKELLPMLPADKAHPGVPQASPHLRDLGTMLPRLRFFATDSTEKFQRLGQRFLGLPIEHVEHVDLKE